DLTTRKAVLSDTVVQERITQDDVKNLQKPLLLADKDRFYVALNHPVNMGKVGGGALSNNFANGLRCAPVTGWFCSFPRGKGDFWPLQDRTDAQMIVLEQFQALPVLLFSVRFAQQQAFPNGGMRIQMVSETMSVEKESGKLIWAPTGVQPTNG